MLSAYICLPHIYWYELPIYPCLVLVQPRKTRPNVTESNKQKINFKLVFIAEAKCMYPDPDLGPYCLQCRLSNDISRPESR